MIALYVTQNLEVFSVKIDVMGVQFDNVTMNEALEQAKVILAEGRTASRKR